MRFGPSALALLLLIARATSAATATKPFTPDIGDVHEHRYDLERRREQDRTRARPTVDALYGYFCRARRPYVAPPLVFVTPAYSAGAQAFADELWDRLAAEPGAQRHRVGPTDADRWQLLGTPPGFAGSEDAPLLERYLTAHPGGPVLVDVPDRWIRHPSPWFGPWLARAVAEGRYATPSGSAVSVRDAAFVVFARTDLSLVGDFTVADLVESPDYADAYEGCEIFVVDGFRAKARLRCELNLGSFTSRTP